MGASIEELLLRSNLPLLATTAIRDGSARLLSISRGLYTLVDADNYAELRSVGSWTAFDCKSGFYAGRVKTINKKRQLIMMAHVVANTPDGMTCDHIHGHTLDNRRTELANVTKGYNRQNKHNLQKNNNSGIEGVLWDPKLGKWRAHLTHNKQRYHFGLFDSFYEAAAVRIAKFEEICGEELCRTSTLHQNNKQLLAQLATTRDQS